LSIFHYQFSIRRLSSAILHAQAKKYLRAVPDVQPGYTVRVHEKIQEGEKERVQIFEGLVISVHRGHTPADTSFIARRVVSGVGVERIFALHSPSLVKIEVKKVAKVRRAKLHFLRGRTGRNARLNERFTDGDEFAVAVIAPKAAAEAPVETVADAASEPEAAATERTEA
jgi:large subunit ribosomal protein L19